MNLLRALIAPLHIKGRFFSSVEVSGAHERSLDLLRRGKADVAAIDCVTYALLERYRPAALAGTRILCRSGRVPAPPYVTSAASSDRDVERLRRVLCEVLSDPALSSVKETLLIDSIDVLPLEAYEPIAESALTVLRLGYSEIP
jgi:ABC-type phosphate/phosphonate transport system substrate-binding protein